MAKYLKYIGIMSILLFSFYYTEKMNDIVINNSSLVTMINENRENYTIESVSAVIDGNYIIPGLNGEAVNVLKSYNNMKYLDTFNSYYLVYDVIKPTVSLDDNLDKIIKYANSDKSAVAIIVKDNEEIISYASSLNINITRLVTINTYSSNAIYEQINNDFEYYNKVETLLNKDNINKNICLVNNTNKEYCKNANKYLVEYSLNLTNSNIVDIKKNIESGYIFQVEDNVSLADFKIFLRQIYYQDLDILPLSKLISEERD